MYGTHDYLAQYALKWLPADERAWIVNETYFYGTELPDSQLREGFDDAARQHIYFNPNGSVADGVMAQKSIRKYNLTIDLLRREKNDTASKWAGSIVHYISEAGLWGNVMKRAISSRRFEQYVLIRTDIIFPSSDFESLFSGYLAFDSLDNISPYDAVLKVANATYFGDEDGRCNAKWMDENYNVSDPEFLRCAGRNFNNIINAIADVIHSIYMEAKGEGMITRRTINWNEKARVPSVILNFSSEVYGKNDTISANIVTNLNDIFYSPAHSWRLFKLKNESENETWWEEVDYGVLCEIPSCEALCSGGGIGICGMSYPGCRDSTQGEINWSWDREIPKIRRITGSDCPFVDGFDTCYEMVSASPGQYNLTFEYLWRCPYYEDFFDERNIYRETLSGTFILDFPEVEAEQEESLPTSPSPATPEEGGGWWFDFTILVYVGATIGIIFGILFTIRQIFIFRKKRRLNEMRKEHKVFRPSDFKPSDLK